MFFLSIRSILCQHYGDCGYVCCSYSHCTPVPSPQPQQWTHATLGEFIALCILEHLCFSFNGSHLACQLHLVLLQWVPWFLRMKRPGENGDPSLPHSHTHSQNKSLASPTTTTTTTTIPTPVPSVLPQSLTSLQASLAQLNHPISAAHRTSTQAVVLPNHNHRDSLPNGHLPYMGFQSFQTTSGLEPVQRNRTTSHGRGHSGFGSGESEGAAGGGQAGDTPTHQHLPQNKCGNSPQETPLALDPEPSTTSMGLEAGAGAGRVTSSHSGAFRSGAVDNQLRALLVDVQYMVERVREQDRLMSLAEQWQFAAAVVDRLCLVGFSVFNIICTIAILMAAPNFGEALSKDFL